MTISMLFTSLLYLNVLVNNKHMKAMIDTGANRTFISFQALSTSHNRQFIDKKQKIASLANGQTSISILGTLDLHIVIGDMPTSIRAYVVKDLCAECILGMNFISKYKALINADARVVSICDNGKRVTLEFDVNQHETRCPARTLRYTHIPQRRTVSIPVNMGISSAKVLFRPFYQLARRSPMILLNNIANVNQQKSHISIYNYMLVT